MREEREPFLIWSRLGEEERFLSSQFVTVSFTATAVLAMVKMLEMIRMTNYRPLRDII